MKHTWIASVLLISAGTLACSWIVDFAVSNRSHYAIDVLYRVDNEILRCPLPDEWSPAFSPTASMGWWRPNPDWRELASDEYSLDKDACSIRLRLPPDTSLRIVQGGTTADPTYLSNGISLTIESQSGTLALSGLELASVFKRRSKTLYEFSYRSPKPPG